MSAPESVYIAIILVSPLTFCLGWGWALQSIRRDRASWRNRITLVALALVTAALVCWPIMFVTSPRLVGASDPRYVETWDHVSENIDAWHRVVFKFTALGFVLCIFGRPKAIAPIMVSAVGISLFWLFSTAL